MFYGDSITEQNHYTGLVETYLLTRVPDRELAFFNYGWSGDTARGGAARWARDAAVVKPTLVFIDFGMNDGAYGGFADWILDAWLPPLKDLLGQVRAGGGRTVLVSPSVTDPHDPKTEWLKGYDDTLASMTTAEQEFGRAEGVPVLDLNTPMRTAMAQARKTHLATFVPDGIHPNLAGALLMAGGILRGLDLPRGLGDLVIHATSAAAPAGVRVDRFIRGPTGISLDLALPYLPFWVPREARPALAVSPFTADLNRFRLVVDRGAAGASAAWWLVVDGRTLGRFTPGALAGGVDLTDLDAAPWARAGRALWDTAIRRNTLRFQAWREDRLGGQDWGGAVGPRSPAVLATAMALEAAAEALAGRMRALARPPAGYHLELLAASPGSRAVGYPRVLEGFEDPALPGMGAWDESVALTPVTDRPTEGARALQVSFNADREAGPSVSVDLPAALDLSETPALALDVRFTGTGPAAAAVCTLSLGPEKKSKKDKPKSIDLKAGREVAAGSATTLRFDLGGVPPAARRAIASFSLSWTASATAGPATVTFDNLRAVE